MSERNFMLEAKALTEQRKYSEATNVLKAGVEQAEELHDRMFCAGTVVSSIVHYNHGGKLPPPGTLDHEECRKYAKIALAYFDQADVVTRSGFHDKASELRTALNQLERGTAPVGAYQPSKTTGCLSSLVTIGLLCFMILILIGYWH
jgi:hypothetical protein